jgi:hypothetical protein
MNPVRRFYGRTAVLSAVAGALAVGTGIAGLASGFLDSTTISVVLVLVGLGGLDGARSTWKFRSRIPDELPPAPKAEALARQRRRINRFVVVIWVASLGFGYAVLGILGLISVGFLEGISLVVGVRLSYRMIERWHAASPPPPRQPD